MTFAHDAVAPPEPKRWDWLADNLLVRAVGRIPLPLGAKLIAGFAIIGALLAIVAVLGLVALGHSNTRGKRLPSLQFTASIERLLENDAAQLESAIDHRIVVGNLLSRGGIAAANNSIVDALRQLCVDGGVGGCGFGPTSQDLPRFGVTLAQIAPSQLQALNSALSGFYSLLGIFPGASSLTFRDERRFAASFTARFDELASRTESREAALVAANRTSYDSSRKLLIGVGAGSFALAIALGLLLAASVVAPLRRTQGRLAEIAGGDFVGHVEVPNRDEIGALAADVNRTSDELQRLYEELATASRHKSDFLATMSHELRTPLNAIIGFSEVLQEQMFGELNERQLAYVSDVHEAGKHLLSLINDVLDLAKIEAGRMELELTEVAVPEVLRSAVSMHSERAGRGGIELALATRPEEITITADERRLRQIVFNLLSNAVKFTPPDGHIDVTAQLSDSVVEIAVADTGPGIAAQDQETIFEEFEQTSDGKKAEGTGLGLPLSRRLVELHGGRLWVESEPGHGSTFRFTLPVRQEVS
jgi:signal transduction histidine kinase